MRNSLKRLAHSISRVVVACCLASQAQAQWTYSAWTGDANSGISNASPYTVAVNCAGAATTVNGVAFQASATSGTNFSIGGGFVTFPSAATNVTGDSSVLASSFIYNGNPRTVTLTNLTPGATYETSLFSFGWEASGRSQTFTSGSDSIVLDQDFYGNRNGIRIAYTFVANSSGSQLLTITPGSGGTFHMSALANREVAPAGPQAKITGFGPGATIGPVAANAAAILWVVPSGSNLTALTPTFTLSDGATCTVSGIPPVSGETRDFSSPVNYIVRASDFATSGTFTDYTVTVTTPTPTTTVLVSSGNPTTYGQNVTFTATVSPIPSGGTVQFWDGENYLGTPVTVNTSTGVATYSTTTLAAANHAITADYSGNYAFEASTTAAPLSQEVGLAPLTVTASNVARQVNTANPDPLLYQITGFQNGQNLATSGVIGTPVLTTDATLSSPVGNYTITCAQGSLVASNYSFTLANGTLTVTNLAGQLGVLNLSANGGINPATGQPWKLGDTYRLIFVTSGTTPCTSTDITTYNAFVQVLANAAGLGSSALGPVTWKAVGSTAAVAARDNTATNPGVNGVGEPILRMDGTFVIANNYADLWNGINNTHVAGQNYLSVHLDENGVERIDERVRTGSSGNGTAAGDGRVLGGSAEATPRVQTGRNYAPDFYGGLGGTGWMQDWSEEATSVGRLYAISGILTIVSATSTDPYQIWLGEFTFAPGADTTPTGDPDGDGMNNQEEFAFGLNPTLGSSVNPIVTQLDPVTGNFQYTRRATPAATGLTYTVFTSTNLATWAAVGATETGFTTSGNIQTVTVNVTAPPVDGRLFVRVEATPTPAP